MATTYSDELGDWVKRRKSTRSDTNLVAFLAVRDDVKEALEAGYTVTAIWQNLYEGKRINVSYDTFLNYVNRHIRRQPAKPADEAPARPAPPQLNKPVPRVLKAAPGNLGPPVQKPDALSGFTFNSTPKKEDLI